ncbi:MAG: EthD domain-containing protein [Microbacteriaceae bacterium]
MFKTVLLIKFRDDVDREEARRNWRTKHAEITISSPGVRRYVQNHWTSPIDGVPALFDGSVEIWTDDEAAFRALNADPEMFDDAVQFFDLSGAAGAAVTQYVLHSDLRDDELAELTRPDRRP